MNNEAPMKTASGIRSLRPAENACRTVYIVDDDAAERRSTSALLQAAHYTVRAFPRARALLAAVDERTMGILLLDLCLADMSGLMLQNELNKRGIGLKTIFVSGAGTIQASVQAIKGGAIDFIQKPFSDGQLLKSVEVALAVAIANETRRRQRSELEKRYELLTQREREIMNFLIRGDTNRKLAERFGLSSRTVEIHRSKIMRKLNVTCIPDLVRTACARDNFQPEEVLVEIAQGLRLPNDQVG